MITRMTKYSFILLSGDKEVFLQKLQELGVVDITRSTKPVDAQSRDLLTAIEEKRSEIRDIENGSDSHLLSLLEKEACLRQNLKALAPWGEYDPEALAVFNPHFYCIQAKRFNPVWAEDYALEIVGEEDGKLHFVVLGDNAGLPVKEQPAPAESLSAINASLTGLEVEISGYRQKLEARKAEIPALEKEAEELASRLNLHLAGVAGESAAEDSLVVFEGFAPTEEDVPLKEALDAMPVYYAAEEAKAEDKPPIKLRNNAFIKQFEVLTGMYGMPVYDEFDPTVFLSIFFLLFFAMCMGDAGYGILLVAIGFALKGKKGGLAKLWSLIVTLGAGTFVVGLLMGGFFGIDLSTHTWVPEGLRKIMITGDITIGGSTYAKQMVLSLLIGVVHISLAMIMKAVYAVRNNGVKNSLGTLGWTLLIVGGVVALAVGLPGLISEEAMKLLLISIAVVSALGIYLFNKWGRNPLLNIGSGLWDTYSMASGLMGDVLSYIRLYALGLSGGMLGSTFNYLADMVKGSDPTWQWLPAIIILLLGHALNLAMSCLGAFVHPLRLNFVEFFKNSDYQGRGNVYNPLKK